MPTSNESLARTKRSSRTLHVISEPDKRERIPFYPTQEDTNNLNNIKRLAGTNNNQAIRVGLKWYSWMLEQKAAGATIQVVRGDRVFELLTL